MKKLKIKMGDTVRVIAGDHKGSEGKILKLFTHKDKAIVEGVNLVKRHTKPNAQNPQGGIVEKESSIHISNIMIVSDGDATRIGRKANDKGKMVRYSKKTGKEIK